MIPNVIDVSEATFQQDVIKKSHEMPVVVDFWAPWCGPCRMLGPVLEKLANEPDSGFVLAKINVDNNQNVSRQYHVQGIPAVKGFRNGKVAAEFVGALPEPRIRAWLKELVPSETDELLGQAVDLIDAGEWGQAEGVLRDVLVSRPGEPTATIHLARTLLYTGNGCEAESLLADSQDPTVIREAERLLPLARYLCEDAQPAENGVLSLEAKYRSAAGMIGEGDVPAGLEILLDVLRYDKRYRNGEAKNVMLSLFALLGDTHPLTQQYRPQLAIVLF